MENACCERGNLDLVQPAQQHEGQRILVADDESDVRDTLSVSLELQGYNVLQAADGAEAVTKVRTMLPDAVLLDLLMPVMDGMTALHTIRVVSSVPIIMVSGRDDEDGKVAALRRGADDYVVKPFDHRELLARIENMLHRAARDGAPQETALVVDEDLTIDFDRNRVIRQGSEYPLTATEHRLLYHLVRNAGRLLPFETLLAQVWGSEYREEIHYVRLYVSYLRAKIEPDPAHPKYILTEKGLGYRFALTGGRARALTGQRSAFVLTPDL